MSGSEADDRGPHQEIEFESRGQDASFGHPEWTPGDGNAIEQDEIGISGGAFGRSADVKGGAAGDAGRAGSNSGEVASVALRGAGSGENGPPPPAPPPAQVPLVRPAPPPPPRSVAAPVSMALESEGRDTEYRRSSSPPRPPPPPGLRSSQPVAGAAPAAPTASPRRPSAWSGGVGRLRRTNRGSVDGASVASAGAARSRVTSWARRRGASQASQVAPGGEEAAAVVETPSPDHGTSKDAAALAAEVARLRLELRASRAGSISTIGGHGPGGGLAARVAELEAELARTREEVEARVAERVAEAVGSVAAVASQLATEVEELREQKARLVRERRQAYMLLVEVVGKDVLLRRLTRGPVATGGVASRVAGRGMGQRQQQQLQQQQRQQRQQQQQQRARAASARRGGPDGRGGASVGGGSVTSPWSVHSLGSGGGGGGGGAPSRMAPDLAALLGLAAAPSDWALADGGAGGSPGGIGHARSVSSVGSERGRTTYTAPTLSSQHRAELTRSAATTVTARVAMR